MAFVICALNEEKIIRQKIENALAMQYPEGKLRIVAGFRWFGGRYRRHHARIRRAAAQFIDRKQRRGKVTNLNEVVVEPVRGCRRLLRRQCDLRARRSPEVGRPAGGSYRGLRFRQGDSDRNDRGSETVRRELLLRGVDAPGAGLTVVLHGGSRWRHARRAALAVPPVSQRYVDRRSGDAGGRGAPGLSRGLRVWCRWPGRRGVTSIQEEFCRKTRIAAGAAQGLLRGNVLPFGAPARFWFIFVSHKLLRWLSPFVGGLALVLALAAPDHLLSQAVLAGFAALSLLALIRLATGWTAVFLDAPFYFLFGQVALFWGLIKGAAGKQSVMWAKLNR